MIQKAKPVSGFAFFVDIRFRRAAMPVQKQSGGAIAIHKNKLTALVCLSPTWVGFDKVLKRRLDQSHMTNSLRFIALPACGFT
ncbi:hypothetical protein LVJ83_12215 [Uruburuella testudinis]|uniref:Uncharacterized protein n=1 Tax=Uruburuella testudinis TaxID=1282863 RepID=A0ABY4DUJ2_9NEIS|nr:hypothetical protein [Uruburuella testudinis]UOO81669.1 hypothetical protein LVJ83_12215 [Uruburuella testudinis]